MDQALAATEKKLEVVHEPDQGPAAGVEVFVRGGSDPGPRGVRHQPLEAGEGGVRILRSVERLDAVASRGILAAGDAGTERRAGRQVAGQRRAGYRVRSGCEDE